MSLAPVLQRLQVSGASPSRDTAVGSLTCAVSVPKSTMPPRIRWLRNALREDDGSWPFACWQPESGRQIYQYSCPYADPHSFCSSYSLVGLQKPRFVISGFRSKISDPNPATHHTLGSHSGIGICFLCACLEPTVLSIGVL